MSRRAKSVEQTLDEYLDAASKEQLIRLRSEVYAVLRWKHGMFYDGEQAAYTKRARKPKDAAQLPLAAKEGS